VFSLLFEECAADPECNQKYPNLEATFYHTVDELNANPASVELDHGTILVDGGFFMEALYVSFYSTNEIPLIPGRIDYASQGNLTGLRNMLGGLLSDTGTLIAIGFEWSCSVTRKFRSSPTNWGANSPLISHPRSPNISTRITSSRCVSRGNLGRLTLSRTRRSSATSQP
jgi:hypothetical protein